MDAIIVSNRLQNIAKDLAHMSEHHFRVGALIVKGRRVLSTGYNKTKTHTIIRNKIDRYSLCDKLHAEMAAILNARTDIIGAKLYILRVCPDNKYGTGMSKPCNLCMRLIRASGIKDVFYTTGDPKQPWVKERIINL
jgi:deoxycytidylate deaminase